ncbi:MAG: 50S ribosomal protein L11 methyltransferase [Candidatus Promineifilaceae bacterium]|nr:50S ribosomal protein L11 methyltransferase [Candidatus Promineifilaceae bacterium]
MHWLEVAVAADGEAAEAISEFLRPFAHQQSVVLEQLGDESSADPRALQAAIRVKIYIPGEQDTKALRQRIAEGLYFLGMLYPIPEPAFRVLEETDWATAWRQHYRPFQIGRRLWIQPSWQAADSVAADDVVLTLDPGMAFGTGTHPSTRMCLQVLEAVLGQGAKVLDVGTGSGILAVAAAGLGASSVVAFDVDWQAAISATSNAQLNGVASRVHAFHGELAAVAPRPVWDFVLVNILAPVIIQLLENQQLLDYLAPAGRLILSGIIAEQSTAVEDALVRHGGRVIERLSEDDWICLHATKG